MSRASWHMSVELLIVTCSLIWQRVHIVGCSSVIPIMPKCSSSLAGCTINRAPTTLVRNRLLSTLRNQWPLVSLVPANIGHAYHADGLIQIKTMHKAGIYSGAVTCHSRSTPRRTRPTSKQSIVTVGTRPSGVLLVCSIIRSTSTAMRSMRTLAQSD